MPCFLPHGAQRRRVWRPPCSVRLRTMELVVPARLVHGSMHGLDRAETKRQRHWPVTVADRYSPTIYVGHQFGADVQWSLVFCEWAICLLIEHEARQPLIVACILSRAH
jgi:hypothetical protein